MNIRFHSFFSKDKYSWNPAINQQLRNNLKATKDDVHIFIEAPLNWNRTVYRSYNYNCRADIEVAFDVIWESPLCVNNQYNMTEGRNRIIVCTVKKEWQ